MILPVPRGVLIFLIVTHLFAVIWWFVMPTWPLGTTYTKGLLGTDQRKIVEEKLVQANAARAPWVSAIEKSSFDEILANPQLMQVVKKTGHQLFGDNCAACHGRDGRGGDNYPDLTDHDWIWGGGPERIAETLRVGVNSRHAESRASQMPSFGRDEMLDPTQVRSVATYVHSLSNPVGLHAPDHRQDRGGPAGVPDQLCRLSRRGRQGQPGPGSAQSDRSILDLWRRP